MMIENTNQFELNSAHARRKWRVSRQRKGSVLVLVVGVLAVLAAMALSYITVVRIDRRSTDAYQEQENLQQQVVAVSSYLQAMLAADLFGNQMTNASTRKNDPITNELVWPKAFEDGEYFDYPWTNVDPSNPGVTLTGGVYTWDTRILPSDPPSQDSLLPRLSGGRLAFADDAWLSPLEPIDTGNSPLSNDGSEWDTWPQITNLLSAYRYRRSDPNQVQLLQWTRDSGRFVDLGQFLLQRPLNSTTPRHAFPGANLTLNKDQNAPWRDPPLAGGVQNGPELGVNQKIFDLQMADLQDEFYWPTTGNPSTPPIQGQRELLPADERFWADTDGDGRPDARWQQLDALGNAFGKVWVVAARIIDNSAMANPNAHISSGIDPLAPVEANLGDGRTPADVDLYRLFASQVATAQAVNPQGVLAPSAHPDITFRPLFDVTHLNASFLDHLFNGLRVPSILNQLDQIDLVQNAQGLNPLGLRDNRDFITIGETWPATGTLFGDQMQSLPLSPLELKRVERAAIWRFFGSSPLAPVASTGAPYLYRDEIDLRTFSGFNLLRTVSRLEQRFDGPRPPQGDEGFLPGITPRYNSALDGPVLGPMRSKEWDIPSQSPRTFSDTFILDDNFGDGVYTNKEKLERQRKDIRHLLTTISGSGSIGPVPVLNPALDQQFSTRKVDLRLFENPRPTLTQQFDIRLHVDRIRKPLTDAFSAFLWALAPLATNQPLMSPLDRIDLFTYAQLANDADLHYGGGATGPASKMAEEAYGLNLNNPDPGVGDDIGAAYAVLRAASLAVNTADAIDNETVPGDATTETPTMVRLFNQPDLPAFLNLNSTLRILMEQDAVIPLGVRFPQGDIWGDPQNPPVGAIMSGNANSSALPPQVVGEPENGVTLVGLDRQPFLVQAVSIAVYADTAATLGTTLTDGVITPDTDPQEQLGSFLAVELGNPWPEPLSLANYTVRIDNGTDQIVIDFLNMSINGGSIIPAGQTVVFYQFRGPLDPIGSAVADWQIIRDEIYSTFSGNSGGEPANIREINDTLAGTAIISGASDMFRPFVGASLPVLLVRTIQGTGGAGNTEVLVDRLSPDPTGSDPFPATLTGDFVLSAPGALTFSTGRVAVQSSLRRSARAVGNGFPGYVIERPVTNVLNVQSDGNNSSVTQAWIVGGANAQPPLPVDDIATGLTDLGETKILGALEVNNPDKIDLPNFEMFVPNGPMLATSELGQLCVFAHMYIHQVQTQPNVDNAWNMSGFLGPDKWVTVSEQLGWDAHYFYDNNPSPPPGDNINPYLGVLDLSRFILDGQQSVLENVDLGTLPNDPTLLPDTLAVPLATRVFDAFEAIPTPSGGFVQGRINVNTAPKRILELLPFVDPRDPINGLVATIAGWTSTPSNLSDTRVQWLDRYRRRDVETPGTFNTVTNDGAPNFDGLGFRRLESYTQLAGLRTPGFNAPWSLGLVNSGELATMGLWSNARDGLLAGQTVSTDIATSPAFLELGANNQINEQIPLDVRIAALGTEASDDPEERLAIFRAISNIVSTRSDIFTAWFILRAYDPKDIEAITISPDIEGDDNAIVSLMNPGNPNGIIGVSRDNPGLIPSFERRVLVIFDRSNVRRPTDRPRILLQVELPIR